MSTSSHGSSAHTGGRRSRRSALAFALDVVLLGSIWGSSVALQRVAVAEVEPFALVSLRLTVALTFFLPLLPRVWRGLSRNPWRALDVWVLGAMNPFMTGVLSAVALMYASSGVVAVLNALTPVLTAVLARFILRERPLSWAQLMGLGLAFMGVLVLIATGGSGLTDDGLGDPRGPLAGLTIAFIVAFGTLYARRRLVATDPLAMAAGQIAGGLSIVGPAALLFGGPVVLADLSLRTWVAILVSGLIGLGASFWLFLGMIERHGPTASLLSMYVMPVAAMAVGAVLLGEQVTVSMAAGAILVLGGVILFTRS